MKENLKAMRRNGGKQRRQNVILTGHNGVDVLRGVNLGTILDAREGSEVKFVLVRWNRLVLRRQSNTQSGCQSLGCERLAKNAIV